MKNVTFKYSMTIPHRCSSSVNESKHLIIKGLFVFNNEFNSFEDWENLNIFNATLIMVNNWYKLKN